MNILMVSATFPYPPTLGGTPVRTFNLLKYLGARHRVTVVTQRSPAVSEADVAALGRYVSQVVTFPRPDGDDLAVGLRGKLARLARFVASGRPPSVWFVASPAMQAWIDDWVARGQGDVITCEHSVNEVFIRPDYRHRIPKVVVDIHSSLYGTVINQLQTGTAEKPLRDLLSVPLMRRYERRYTRKFTDLVVTTREDLKFFAPMKRSAPLQVVPNGVDLDLFTYRPADPGGQGLIFVGAMDYIANVDTAQYLAREILPGLRQRYPAATLTLVGARPTAAVQALGQLPGVTVTGGVPSVVPYLHRATVCVVPMRIGFGIKNKTLEAMAAGVPVVASDRGLEGLPVDDPLAALRANSTAAYGEAIGRLFDQPDLRAQLSRQGRALIESRFTWEAAGQHYEKILMS